MTVKIEQDARGRWTVVKGGEVLAVCATIKEAVTARFDLTQRKPVSIQYFKQDGTPITRRPRGAR